MLTAVAVSLGGTAFHVEKGGSGGSPMIQGRTAIARGRVAVSASLGRYHASQRVNQVSITTESTHYREVTSMPRPI